MPPVVIALVVLVAALFVGVLALIGVRAARLTRELEEAEHKLESLSEQNRIVAGQLVAEQAARVQVTGWLESSEQDVKHYKVELDRRPILTRKAYKILTLGVKATGKTSLTLKWSNPLIDLGKLEGTKIERYERTVSLVTQKDVATQHIFEVHDWGGEHIVDAQQELIVEEINGLLLVVDLGGKDAKQADPNRVQEQLQEFQAQALKYFFGPKTVASCKTVVLFINKSDLLSGTPAQVEEQAEKYYAPLIENLRKFSTQIDVRVFVGSANYGHSTHLLFSHFVQRILPKNAYDSQLVQRANDEFSSSPRIPVGATTPLAALPAATRAEFPSAPTVDPGTSGVAPATQPIAPAMFTAADGGPAPVHATTNLKKTMPLLERPPGLPPLPRKV